MINIKVLLISIIVSLVALGAGDLGHSEFGWDAQRVTALIWSVAFIWVLMDLERERETTKSLRARIETALERLESCR